MTSTRWRAIGVALLLVLAASGIALFVWMRNPAPQPIAGQVLDEALGTGREAETFPAADEDYFHDMDGGVQLTPDEVKGRNTWIVWSGGNDRFWDGLSVTGYGSVDLLKTISSHASLKNSRDNRWEYL